MKASTIDRLLFLLLPLVVLCVAEAGLAQERCSTCHPASRVEFEQSVHAREEVSCTSCHGGDPDSLDTESAHRGRFQSLTDRKAIPRSCASCHSDLAQMRPYNLPVDQYAVYMTSRHGQAVAEGDLNSAVCSDCHGAHDTRGPADPESRVYTRNLPETCGTCHADESLMARYDMGSTVVDEYLEGVHGNALLVEGNLSAPSCHSCHGVHGATPPGVGDIDKVCGSCHAEARRAFLAGPHYPSMAEADLPECSSCHSNHRIERQRLDTLEGLCVDCHGDGSEAAILGQKIHTLITSAAEEVDAAEALVAQAEKVPLHVEDHLSRVEEARTYLTETTSLVHAVSIEPVEQVTRRARSIGEEIRHELYPKLSSKTAQIGLALYWFYVLMTVAILAGHRKRIKRQSEGR